MPRTGEGTTVAPMLTEREPNTIEQHSAITWFNKRRRTLPLPLSLCLARRECDGVGAATSGKPAASDYLVQTAARNLGANARTHPIHLHSRFARLLNQTHALKYHHGLKLLSGTYMG